MGTMAHSWVQMFESEYDAFKAYARLYPDNCILLVDTYNTLKSGVPNAIKVFKEIKPKKMGIRIDSGDITYLSKRARRMMDEAGLSGCDIVVSNSFDEHLIRDVIRQGASINSFGVGERLITARSEPVFGGVYKMVAIEKDGKIVPKIKISDNIEKITTPGFKTLYRLYDNATKKAIADVITLDGEVIPEDGDYEIFDPQFIWKRKTLRNFTAKNLRKRIFDKGKLVYKSPPLEEIRAYCLSQIDTLWDEILRFENPHKYYVDLSLDLWDVKTGLIKSHKY